MKIPIAWHIVAQLRRKARAAANRRITECLIERIFEVASGPVAILLLMAIMVALAYISAPTYMGG